MKSGVFDMPMDFSAGMQSNCRKSMLRAVLAFAVFASSPCVAAGRVAVTDKGMVGNVAYYHARSVEYPAAVFSLADLNDYAFRVTKRMCLDPDLQDSFRIGMRWRYDFFGADGIKVGDFEISRDACRKYGWK